MSTLRISLPREISSPAEARRQVQRFAIENGVEDPAIVVLVVSELVTNAVLHGAEPIEVRASIDAGTVRIEVSDSDPDVTTVVALPRLPQRIGGRGLEIVDSVTSCWGATSHGSGKTVWAEMGSNDRARGAARS